MKTILSVLIITALLSGNVNADQRKSQKGANADQVIASLQLETATATNLKSLLEKQREERQASRKQEKKDRELRQEKRKQDRKALLEVLGYEKLYEFEAMMHQNRNKRSKQKRGE